MLSKEDKKIKKGESILTFTIHVNEYKTWLSVETAGISKQLELSFLKNGAKTQSIPFSSYTVFVIRCKVIFISIKASYLE